MSYTEADLEKPILAALKAEHPRPLSSRELEYSVRKTRGLEKASSSECYRAAHQLVARGLVTPTPWNGLYCFQLKTGFASAQ